MRRIALFLFATLGIIPAASAALTFEFKADRGNPQPGDTVTFTVTIKNDDAFPTSGNYTNYIYVPDNTSTTTPESGDARITCTAVRKQTTGGQDYWYHECSSSGSLRLEGGQSVTTTFQYKVSEFAKPGDTFTLDSTVRLGTGFFRQKQVTLTVVPAGPRLIPSFSAPTVKVLPGSFSATFDVTITNVGKAPTSGEVTFSIDRIAPSGAGPSLAPAPQIWDALPSNWHSLDWRQIRTSEVLQRDASWHLRVVVSFPRVRGTYGLKGKVEGGGSTAAEARSADMQYDPTRITDPVVIPPPAPIGGRR